MSEINKEFTKAMEQCKTCKENVKFLLKHVKNNKGCKTAYTNDEINSLEKVAKERRRKRKIQLYSSEKRRQLYQKQKLLKPNKSRTGEISQIGKKDLIEKYYYKMQWKILLIKENVSIKLQF